jgi:hypothetical protein
LPPTKMERLSIVSNFFLNEGDSCGGTT